MEDSTNLDTIMRFMDQSSNTRCYDELAKLVLEMNGALNLVASFSFFSKTDTYFFSANNFNSAKEKILMSAYRDYVLADTNTTGRFRTFSQNIIVATEFSAMLVKHIPADEVAMGRLRDLLGCLINSVDARVASVERIKLEQKQMQINNTVISELEMTMSDLQNSVVDHERRTMGIMDTLMIKCQEALMALGLTEDQENFFSRMLEDSMERLSTLYAHSSAIENRMEDMLKLLKSSSKK